MSDPPAGGAWHATSAEEVLASLGTSAEGLSAAEARERLDREGPNALPRGRREGPLRILVRQVAQPLIYVLAVAAALSAVAGHTVDAGVIAGVIVANALIGFVQEHRAGRQIEALSALMADECSVLRDGEVVGIDTRDVVPGDVLLVQPGDRLPADARILDARGLTVDEAPLTGESVSADKSASAVAAGAPLGDRSPMLHAGTLVSAGRGRAVVVATGSGTELARIAELVESAEELATPLTRSIAAFGRTVSLAILALAAATFGVTQAWDYSVVDGFLAAVAFAVAAIPEGLPAIMTIALAAGVRRMAGRNALVRRLPAVETLGSTAVVCTDKTGTLTRGEMVVTELWAGDRVGVEGAGYEPEGSFRSESGGELDGAPEWARGILEASVLASDARLASGEDGPGIVGDPTEGALVVAAAKAGIRREDAEGRRPRRDVVPFESERQLMATLHEDREDGGGVMLVKGSPEAVVGRCSSAAWSEDWDAEAVLSEARGMAARGLRVLAVAARGVDDPSAGIAGEDPGEDLRLLGLVGSMDPPREEAVRAVEVCRRAGIRVVMITGDHPATARAIAAELGVDAEEVAAGADLDDLSDEEIEDVARRVSVFARVAPEHKLRLVAALQRRGEVAAMTGDGVNDAPALRQADIGVAMGVTGTDVSKEASDIVLLDDNFASIAAAVREGRRVYDNLIRSIAFVLPTSAGQALLVLGVVAFGLTLPLVPVQILWINMVTAVALALPLAVEAEEPDAMERPPRRPGEPVLGRFVVERVVLVAGMMLAAGVALFELETARGAPLPEARTTVATAIILIQAVYLFTCRSLRGSPAAPGLTSNPWVYVGAGATLAAQAAFVHAPVMNTLFDSAPIGAREWGIAAGVGLLALPVVEGHRRLVARFRDGREPRPAASGPPA